jgi:hypothetical protein
MEKYMKILRSVHVLCLTLAGLLLAGTAAKADTFSFALDAPYQNAVAGQTIKFFASVSNTDPSATVYLNGDTPSAQSPLTLDDSPYSFFPQFLSPESIYDGELFDVTVPLGTPDGLYAGSFAFLGGSDNEASDLLGSAEFNVNVTGNATPEPSSFVLLVTGLAGLGGALRRRLARSRVSASGRLPATMVSQIQSMRSVAIFCCEWGSNLDCPLLRESDSICVITLFIRLREKLLGTARRMN